MIGTTLSHFKITAKLGEGGMGEVYRAEDTRLRREVAIKVLPAEVAQDAERLARFEREAHLLAALNHPNIAAIYGLERHEGRTFLALELVEGEELKERLERGAIPVEDALEIALQVAEAVEEAHNRGIVHRDLKPANVKLSPDGKVKVLDFGLAKAWAGDAEDGSSPPAALSQSPTVQYAGSVVGVIMGTAAYMSPEQARGRPVDKRADVWAFGVLLWEMLTGRTLFPGDTVTDVIAAVLTQQPDLDLLPEETPAAVRQLISRCVRKDPRSRLPDIGAARLELQDALGGNPLEFEAFGTSSTSDSREERQARVRERWGWAAVSLIALGFAVALAVAQLTETPEPRPAAHFPVEAPEGWSLSANFLPAASPDGRQVLFAANPENPGQRGGQRMLWVRSLESLAARPLAGTEGVDGFSSFWSFDSRSIGFEVDGVLKKLHLENGSVQTICTMPQPILLGGDWSDEDTILFSAGEERSQVYSVPSAGGAPQVVTVLETISGVTNAHFPQRLAGGRELLFLVGSSEGEDFTGTYVAPLDAPQDGRRIAPGWIYREDAADHLLFLSDGVLYAQPSDTGRAELRGEARPLVSSVASAPWSPDVGIFSVSPGGTLAYLSGTALADEVQLAWVGRSGNRIEMLGQPRDYGQIALAPDERSAAVEIRTGVGEYDLWVMDLRRGVSSRVTVAPGEERDPVWAPDSRSLAFATRGDHGADLRRKGLRASDAATVVANSQDEDIPEDWSRDGKTMLVVRRNAEDMQSVWAVPVGGSGEAEPILDTGFRVDEPQLSPDGRWLAYVSPESGRDEVYIEPYRRDGLRVQVSVAGGGQPKWRSDGTELFYATLDHELAAVELKTAGDRLEVGLPVSLFELQGLQGTGYDDYAVSQDGQRFLVKLPVEEAVEPQLHIVTNWTSLLE
jgi:serine/threonine protein kinase